MIKFICYIFLFFSSSICFAQKPKLKTAVLNTKEMESKTFIGFDGLGHNYYIQNNVLFKQSETQTQEYKNVALGKITSVDFINPMQIIVFYEDFNTIVMLDNQLNETGKINLFNVDSNIFASKIGLASQNQFWIYNALTRQIMLFDYLKNTYKNIGNPVQGDIKYTQSDFNNFYWIDEINNWYATDIFGKVSLLANIPPFEKIQIIDNERILFSYDNILYCLNNKSKIVYEIEIVEKSFQDFYFKDQILAIFTHQQIKNYKIKLP